MDFAFYEAAYAYKKAAPWKKFWDEDIIAVKMPSGNIRYLCVMGKAGTYNALGIYPDEDSFQSYYRILASDDYPETILRNELMLSQDCLQCAFEDKEDLDEDEIKEVRAAVKKLGIRISGRNSYAHFLRHEPYKLPSSKPEGNEAEIVTEALQAVTDIMNTLGEKEPEEIGIQPISAGTGQMRLFVKKNGLYVPDEYVDYPAKSLMTFPIGEVSEDDLKRVRKGRKRGVMEMCVVHLPMPVMDQDPGYFPAMLFAADKQNGTLLKADIMKSYEPDRCIKTMIDAFVERGTYPIEIDVEDDRTEQLLSQFAQKMKIRLVRKEELPDLNDAYIEFTESMNKQDEDPSDSVREILEQLEMADEAGILNQMPGDMVAILKMLPGTGMLSEDDEERLQKILKKLK